jgi:segregation and condensation protein A
MPAVQDDYRVELQVFDGPLDLLLHLIRTQEIDIQDIPIAQITEQYLEYIQVMQDLNISVAGEFLAMAATLIYIKSQILLPRPRPTEGEEQNEDPRQELVSQLLEYERFKKAADLLHDREVIENSVWERGSYDFEEDEREAVSVTVFDLIKAFHTIVERHRDQLTLSVEQEEVTVEQRLAELRDLIRVQGEVLFSFFFKQPLSRLGLVVTFVALLEMARLREVSLFQTDSFQDIRIRAC